MKELTKQQIDYIKENIGKKSKRKLAQELGVDKRVILKYLKKLDTQPEPSAIPRSDKKPSSFIEFTSKISPKTWTIISVLFIFTVALIVRLIYIQQLNHGYFWAPFKGGLDDYIFDNWAKEMLRGNWIGDKIIYIYRMPLYVYFLYFTYFLFGHSYWAVYIIQSLIGATSCVLVYFIGKKLFNRATGLIAGLMIALYGLFLFYNGMLVGETLGVAITCLAFLLLLLFQEKPKISYLFMGGLFIGLSMLLRGNMLIVLPFIILWIITFFRDKTASKRASYIFILLLGVLISVSPIIVRNYIYEKDFVPITALGGLNVYIGNAHGADGKYRVVERISNNASDMIRSSIRVAEEDVGKKLKPSQVSNYWLKETLLSIKENGIGPFFSVLIKKTILFWNSYELPDIWDYYFFKQYIPILNLPFFSFLTIIPLSLVGIYLSWSQRRNLSLLYVIIIGYMVSLIAVFITSRYRIQVVPFLAILAAYTVTQIKDILKRGGNKLVICIAILIGGILLSNIPIEKVSFETSYNSLAILLKRDGRIEDAIDTYNKAIEISPQYPTPYYNLGILYRDRGNYDLAISYLEKAVEIAPDFRRAREKLNELYNK